MDNFEAAAKYIDEVAPLIQSNANRLDQLDVMLAQGAVAAGRHQDAQAERIFRTVEMDASAQTSMKLGAEHQLALLYERRGDIAQAEPM